MSTCAVCIEKFTNQPHKKQAICPYCPIEACVKCTQTYLLGTHEDPHCLGCRKSWTREVMDTILLTTWINGDYKIHRQNILLDRERSKLPAAQLIVERRKLANVYIDSRNGIADEIQLMETELIKKRNEFYRLSRIIDIYSRGHDPFANGHDSNEVKEERRAFIMPCTASGCRGFLSQAYKCGVCDNYTCPDCHELKGPTKEDTTHICDPNTIATVRSMKKDCKACPECGTNIFKIEGCNQMFCTNCNTPFDWTTGRKIVHGAIHNPHYFEYLRATNGGVMPRNPGDIPCIANLPNAWQFDRELVRRFMGIPSELTGFLYNSLNTITHIQHVEIPNQTNHAEDMDNIEANVKYLKQEYTEVRWKQILQQREKRRIKRDEVRMRYEAFVGACVDIYGRIMSHARKYEKIGKAEISNLTAVCEEARTYLLTLRTIFNDGMMELSKRYKCQVLQLHEKNLKREMKTYEAGRLRRAKKTDSSTVGSNDNLWDDEPEPTAEASLESGNVLVRLPK